MEFINKTVDKSVSDNQICGLKIAIDGVAVITTIFGWEKPTFDRTDTVSRKIEHVGKFFLDFRRRGEVFGHMELFKTIKLYHW